MPEIKINGALGGGRLPNNINISIPGTNSEKLLLELDKYGIRAGSGTNTAVTVSTHWSGTNYQNQKAIRCLMK